MLTEEETRRKASYGRRLATKNNARQETEVDEGVLAAASPQGPKQVQEVHQLHDGASQNLETKTNLSKIENSNEGSNQCLVHPCSPEVKKEVYRHVCHWGDRVER